MTLNDLSIGTEVYNGGDIMNQEHFGTITNHKKSDRFQDQVEITPDADCDRKPYWITPASFSPTYKGHGGTRFVTRVAYDAWWNQRMEEQRAEFMAAASRIRG